MKMFLGIASILLVCAASPVWAEAAPEPNPAAGSSTPAPSVQDLPNPNIIHGRVMKIDKDDFFIMDAMGQQMHLRVDADTKIQGEPRIGDRIEVEINSTGTASSIKKRG
jgi:hypothetical protein